MRELLQRAVEEIEKLPADAQDEIAGFTLGGWRFAAAAYAFCAAFAVIGAFGRRFGLPTK